MLYYAGELLPSPTEVQIIESFRFHVGKLPQSEITLVDNALLDVVVDPERLWRSLK